MVAPAYKKNELRYPDDQSSCSSAELARSPKTSRKGISPPHGLKVSRETARRRSVRFQVDELGRDNVETFTYEQPPLSCLSDLYWSEHEKTQFTNEARLHVVDFSKRSQQRVRRMEVAFEHCADKNVSDEEQKDNMRAVLKWAASSGRGLEDSIIDHYAERRTSYMRDMIEFFAYLSESFVPGTDLSDDIRLFSECRSLRSREFSFKLALADELTR